MSVVDVWAEAKGLPLHWGVFYLGSIAFVFGLLTLTGIDWAFGWGLLMGKTMASVVFCLLALYFEFMALVALG